MHPLETLAAQLLREQSAQRRWRNFFRLAWLALAFAALWQAMQWQSISHPVSYANKPHTAMVSIVGEIAAEGDASASLVTAALRNAFEDPGAKGIMLRINSPGGSPVQAGIIHDEIARLKILHRKPVVAVVEESATSAAYYIAVAADSIYADKASLIGSIGVLFDGFGAVDLMKKLGIERRLLTAGKHKGMLDSFSPENPEEKAYAQKMLNTIHQQFITVVKNGRGTRLKPSQDTFTGLFWTGQEALDRGLVDGLGHIDYVARDIIHAEEVVDYTTQDDVLERVAKRFGAAVGRATLESLSKLPELQ